MKITKILQKPNKNLQANEKYEPLRKNIQSPRQPAIQENIQKVSLVSRRLKSLSPNQREVIRKITYIPENCGLKVTSNEQKQQKALGQKYVAINMQEKTRTKPITPNTFQNVVRNKKVEVVYEYNYEQGDGQQQSQGKRVGSMGDRKKYQLSQQGEKQQLNSPPSFNNLEQAQRTQTSIMNSHTTHHIRNANSPLGRNIYTEHQVSNRNNEYYANEDNGNSDGPAFWQRQNINKYNQLGRNSKQQYQVRSKKQPNYSGNIEIGGRSKSTTKHTIQDFESSIGINSRHLKNNMVSTKDYSKNNLYNKEDALQGQQTEVKGDYFNDGHSQDDKSRMRGYVQSVQSRIETDTQGRLIGDMNSKTKRKQKLNEINHEQFNAQNQLNQPVIQSPQLEERQRKLKEYQQSQGRGYSFKKNEQTQDQKRKKQQYKYNLYSMCDEQFNLMCKTGLFTPNEICASEPKREGWS